MDGQSRDAWIYPSVAALATVRVGERTKYLPA
jgi:hypothetical protein